MDKKDKKKPITAKPWYLQTVVIAFMFTFSILIFPFIIGIVLLIKQHRFEKEWSQKYSNIFDADQYVIDVKAAADEYAQKIHSDSEELQNKYNAMTMQYDNTVKANEVLLNRLKEEISALNAEKELTDKQLKTSINKLSKSKELYKSIQYSIENFFEFEPNLSSIKLKPDQCDDLEELSPSVILKLHHMDIKSLNKAFRDNDKQIEKVLRQYQGRYTTKANRTIYDLMVIALRSELQNILYNLKYNKLEEAEKQIKQTTKKYMDIAASGNQSIAGTLTKFIGEIEYLFINAAKIEYNYYVKKEQARQEQAAIREQMRQEAEERKALEQERRKVEKEEQKYKNEIDKVKAQFEIANETEKAALNARILELESMLSDVAVKRESIAQLQNGKAGNVYVISNLGSFGDNVFKIGMTRRLEPMDRINELGSASVPFKFDVHSFIFSEDAVTLETKLHQMLNSKRVNKVNLRKEFFYSSIDELEQLVQQIDPTAEFNKTMIAEEYKQSQSSNEIYTSDIIVDEIDDEE